MSLIDRNLDFFFSYGQERNDARTLFWLDRLNRAATSNTSWYSEWDYVDAVFRLMEDAVLDSIPKDQSVPIGVLLSGGMDSFLLLDLIRKNFPDRRIYSFSLCPRFDEQSRSRIEMLADVIGVVHTSYVHEITFKDLLEGLHTMYRYTPFPSSADLGYIVNNFLSHRIRKDRPDLRYIVSGIGVDVLLGGMEMYRYSLLERIRGADFVFRDEHEHRYVDFLSAQYDPEFFSKYGEYFGIPDLGDMFSENTRNDARCYYQKISSTRYPSRLHRQIVFNIAFIIQGRRDHVEVPMQRQGFISVNPFIGEKFIEGILSLKIPDELLLDSAETKKIIRRIAERRAFVSGVSGIFAGTGGPNYHEIYLQGESSILQIADALLRGWHITNRYRELIPEVIHGTMWHENRARIYILLNAYFRMRNRI